MKLDFPWPSKELSPNARVHWSKKAKAAKQYMMDCSWICFRMRPKPQTNKLIIIFHPPNKRRADLDNMLASFKQGIDAIAGYLKVDDSIFELTISKGEPVKHGKVEVMIE